MLYTTKIAFKTKSEIMIFHINIGWKIHCQHIGAIRNTKEKISDYRKLFQIRKMSPDGHMELQERIENEENG